MADVLVAYPGSYKEERGAHKAFRHLNAGRKEVFHLTPELTEHIHNLHAEWPNWRQVLVDVDANDRAEVSATA